MSARAFDWRQMPEFRALAMLVFAFLYLPLFVLVGYGFNGSRLATEWGGFSIQWFVKALGNDDLRRAAANSLITALTATTAATLIAVPAAIAFERARRLRLREGAEAMVALPLVVPDIATAIAVLIFFSTIGLQLGLGNVILAHTMFCIPFALLPIRARLREMPRDIEDAARDLYASETEVFRFVTLPGLMPGIVAGAMLAFVVSLDDFIITAMVAPPGATTLPVYLYGMLRLGVTPEANAAATMLLAVSITVVSLSFIVMRRGKAGGSLRKQATERTPS